MTSIAPKISLAFSALTLTIVTTSALAAPSPRTTDQINPPAPAAVQQHAAPEAPHALTRREVIEDLIRAEKDGSLQRLNDTVYHGS
ncbi:DUF4148 domain-containing protein [Burkholderia lata]|uniref:DUF4148 domain-containing protein n=1 Tax=Burkholderia lata (strain ATCC 17760 / DSM 23089 / LMG 22485 / NCIMB 9086 / R18194 / 383) TaxID=482957 RepID=A0A6P2SAB5_BURL3|nr:DUF4148 domain-containing protein [Burkholderia lata]VWC41866.1 hypothetical protein BLA6863_07098 [Burkholderia lata]